jgi:coenzyme F420-0:L-glutamate ligase / coenzyme F420-1:gamma-L-glutamate ligase
VPRSAIHIFPVTGLAEVKAGDDLPQLLIDSLGGGAAVTDGDVLVVAQKIVSKAERRFVQLESVEPSEKAVHWAAEYQKDPRVIELVLREAARIVRMERGVIVAETRHGFVCANAGVDVSNTPEGTALLLPEDPDGSAREIQQRVATALGASVGVIISDTFGRPWREGLVDVALGVAGIAPLLDYRGKRDASGKMLQATWIAVADELASAAELVMGKTDGVPAAIIRGFEAPKPAGSGRDLIRPAERDIFR